MRMKERTFFKLDFNSIKDLDLKYCLLRMLCMIIKHSGPPEILFTYSKNSAYKCDIADFDGVALEIL